MLAFTVACSDRKNETTGRNDAPAPEAAKVQRALTPGPSKASGGAVVDKLTCPTGCTKIARAEPAPRCCSCAGREGLWTKSTFSATTWICQR